MCLSNLHILVLRATRFYHPQVIALHLSNNITMCRRGVISLPTSIPRVSHGFVFCQICLNFGDSAIMRILQGEIKKQRDLEYLNLFL